jgi:hypothetical protein
MDLVGIFIAIIGAVTVVLSANTSDVRLDPDALVHAISQRSFIVFSCVYIVGAIFLAALSEGKTSRDWVFVDVGLCALFGVSPFLRKGWWDAKTIRTRWIHCVIDQGRVNTTHYGMD